MATSMFKALNGLAVAPLYLADDCKMVTDASCRLRSAVSFT